MQLQIDALTSHGVALEDIHSDVASGSAKYRRGLDAAFKDLRKDDVLIVWSLDRLGRNLEELIKAVAAIEAKGANLRVLTQAIDTTTPGGRQGRCPPTRRQCACRLSLEEEACRLNRRTSMT
jgi:DNA invertase Pin-like site-specific DNA recombinase